MPSSDSSDAEAAEGQKSAIHGLAQAWLRDKDVRRVTRSSGSLLQWPPALHEDGSVDASRSRVSVVDMDALRVNSRVLCHVLELWCPNAADRKTCPVDLIKPEVGFLMFSFFVTKKKIL